MKKKNRRMRYVPVKIQIAQLTLFELSKNMARYVVISHKEGLKLRALPLGGHRDIVDNVRENEGLVGLVLGGGLIKISDEEKRVHAYDQSYEFGRAPKEIVRELLTSWAAEYMPGYSVEVTDY